MNFINVIHPYKYRGNWVFDDAGRELILEPFIAGSDRIINVMTRNIPNARSGFTLIFSSVPFPGHQLELKWTDEFANGNWYYSEKLGMEGWLCPALMKYFDKVPERIYAQFKEGEEN